MGSLQVAINEFKILSEMFGMLNILDSIDHNCINSNTTSSICAKLEVKDIYGKSLTEQLEQAQKGLAFHADVILKSDGTNNKWNLKALKKANLKIKEISNIYHSVVHILDTESLE